MKYHQIIIASCLVCILGDISRADKLEPAPLGLHWGMSVSDVRALGVTFLESMLDRFEITIDEPPTTWFVGDLPKSFPSAQEVMLSFGTIDRLQEIGIKTEQSLVWEEHEQNIINVLTEKYGPPTGSFDNYETGKLTIAVYITGNDREGRSVNIHYVYKPIRRREQEKLKHLHKKGLEALREAL